MKSAEQLRAEWVESEERKAWYDILQSSAWAKLSELLIAEADADAKRTARTGLATAAAPQMAMSLMRMEGFHSAIEAMQDACAGPPKKPEPPIEEYNDEYVKDLMEKRSAAH